METAVASHVAADLSTVVSDDLAVRELLDAVAEGRKQNVRQPSAKGSAILTCDGRTPLSHWPWDEGRAWRLVQPPKQRRRTGRFRSCPWRS